MDSLSHLFTHFQFRTDLFFIGQLCRTGSFDEPNKGYLHFIRQGRCLLNLSENQTILIERPCIVFSPSSVLHHVHPLDKEGLSMLCINFDFGEGIRNPLVHTVDRVEVLFLDNQPHLHALADEIFKESSSRSYGYHAAIHHLCAYFTIQVVRYCLTNNKLQTGLLKGLADKKLGGLLQKIHQTPEYEWTVENMAEQAAMSRSAFAAHFKHTMGVAPLAYLTNWRIAVAQTLLQKGMPVALVAEKVGYSHAAALSRVFTRETGISPSEWLRRYRQPS